MVLEKFCKLFDKPIILLIYNENGDSLQKIMSNHIEYSKYKDQTIIKIKHFPTCMKITIK